MGKVTVFGVVHKGRRGSFDFPKFRKAFGEANVIDLEAVVGMPPGFRRAFNDASKGDRFMYNVLMERFRKDYERTGNEGNLWYMDALDLVFGSGKKVEFEERLRRFPRRGRFVHGLRQKAYSAFPAMREYVRPATLEKFVDKSSGVDERGREILGKYYKDFAENLMPVLVRSYADSDRIRRKMRLNPKQNRLVVRGSLHLPTVRFLRQMGVPSVRGMSITGGYGLQARMLKGERVAPEEVLKSMKKEHLFSRYLGEGMKIREAAAKAGLSGKRRR